MNDKETNKQTKRSILVIAPTQTKALKKIAFNKTKKDVLKTYRKIVPSVKLQAKTLKQLANQQKQAEKEQARSKHKQAKAFVHLLKKNNKTTNKLLKNQFLPFQKQVLLKLHINISLVFSCLLVGFLFFALACAYSNTNLPVFASCSVFSCIFDLACILVLNILYEQYYRCNIHLKYDVASVWLVFASLVLVIIGYLSFGFKFHFIVMIVFASLVSAISLISFVFLVISLKADLIKKVQEINQESYFDNKRFN